MEYQEGKEIRKGGLTQSLVNGKGLGESISENLKAKMLGMKEAVDPLNIAKKLTGGSKLAPALLGKAMGRKQEDIEFFSGIKSKNTPTLNKDTMMKATEILGAIYQLMLTEHEKKISDQEKSSSKKKKADKDQEKKEKALIEEEKPKTRKQKKQNVEKKEKKRKEQKVKRLHQKVKQKQPHQKSKQNHPHQKLKQNLLLLPLLRVYQKLLPLHQSRQVQVLWVPVLQLLEVRPH